MCDCGICRVSDDTGWDSKSRRAQHKARFVRPHLFEHLADHYLYSALCSVRLPPREAHHRAAVREDGVRRGVRIARDHLRGHEREGRRARARDAAARAARSGLAQSDAVARRRAVHPTRVLTRASPRRVPHHRLRWSGGHARRGVARHRRPPMLRARALYDAPRNKPPVPMRVDPRPVAPCCSDLLFLCCPASRAHAALVWRRGHVRGARGGTPLVEPPPHPRTRNGFHGTRIVIFFAGYGYVTTQDCTSRPDSFGLRFGFCVQPTTISPSNPIRVARLCSWLLKLAHTPASRTLTAHETQNVRRLNETFYVGSCGFRSVSLI